MPHEVVELSYRIGLDLRKLQQSYDLTLEQKFADHRQQRLAYLHNVWAPEFIEEWVEDGRLVDTARGVVVYDALLDDFVAPTNGQEQQQMLSTIYTWSDAAIAEVADKRRSLLDPLDHEERKIRNETRAAFDMLIEANAYVTAHLTSIREVHDLQSRALDALVVEDIVSPLHDRLAQVSERAQLELYAIRKADGLVDEKTKVLSRRVQRD